MEQLRIQRKNQIVDKLLMIGLIVIPTFIFFLLFVMNSGLEIFMFSGPLFLVTGFVLSILVRTFSKNSTDSFTIFSSIITICLILFSIKLNLPIIFDSGEQVYFGVRYFLPESVNGSFASPYFSILLSITLIFGLFFTIYTYFKISRIGSLTKSDNILFMVIGILLVTFNLLIIFVQAPQLVERVQDEKIFSVHGTTFLQGAVSYINLDDFGFTLNTLQEQTCTNAEFFVQKIAKVSEEIKNSNVACIGTVEVNGEDALIPFQDTHRGTGSTTAYITNLSIGEIYVITVQVPAGAFVNVEAFGSLSTIDRMKIGSFASFVKQEDRTLSIFFPVTTAYIDKIVIDMFSNQTSGLKIIEIAKITNTEKWRGVQLMINDSEEPKTVQNGSKIKLSWSSSKDVSACGLATSYSYPDQNTEYPPFSDFFDLSPSGEKTLQINSSGNEFKTFKARIYCNDGKYSDSITIPILY